jgi:hypothetical protein
MILQGFAMLVCMIGFVLSIGLSWSNDSNPSASASAWNAAALFFLAFCVLIK